MSKHVTGPWTLQKLPCKAGYPDWIPYCVRSATNVHIATVGDVDRYYEGEQQTANAHLIAAAPELLEALIGLADCAGITALDGYKSELDNAMRIARAAIATATGLAQ